MDSIGLLAAWVGVVSFLIATVITVAMHLITSPLQRWWAQTSPKRSERRIERLQLDIATSQVPDTGYMSDLISLYGEMVLSLVAGVAVVIISIQILDLGPALLAASLPFNINAKLITRATGLFLLFSSYLFVFRLCFLSVKIRVKTLPRKSGFIQNSQKEITQLRRTPNSTVPTTLGRS